MQTTKTVMLPPIEFTYGNIPDRVCAKGRCENMEGAEGYVVCGKDKIRIYVKKFQVMPEGIFQLPKKCTPR